MAKKNKDGKETFEAQNIIDIEKAQEERRKKREQNTSKRKRAQKKKKPKKKSKKQRKKMTRRAAIYLGIFIAVLIFVGIAISQIVMLKMEEKKVLEEYDSKVREKEKLEKELKRVNDPEYIENQARERLRMIRQGEILYVFPQEEEDNSQ